VRLPAPETLHATIPSIGSSLSVLDISEGGLAALTEMPLALRSWHTLELSLGGPPLAVRVQVASCLLVDRRGGRAVYRTGFQFWGRPKPGTGTVEDLLDRLLTASITVV